MKLRIDILPNSTYLKDDGTFDKDEALKLSGKIAGVCYDKEGFAHLEHEDEEKTNKRVIMTLNNGHHSVYDHTSISFNIQNLPKILAMVINNEHQYTTSEKSARYTPVVRSKDSIITEQEEYLYNKWIDLFKMTIKLEYGNVFNDSKIQKLAQENARYLVTVFMPTQMIYTTSLRQINYIASWMEAFISDPTKNTSFDLKLKESMKSFVSELDRLNVLETNLMKNEKNRSISLFTEGIENKKPVYSDVYSTVYKGTFAELAQAHRHRTISYEMQRTPNGHEYFVPPILERYDELKEEWEEDIKSVGEVVPQGELVLIHEMGKYSDFILKCKERSCSHAQLEIMRQTSETMRKYYEELVRTGNPLAEDLKQYMNGARCTFPDYTCPSSCNFSEGIALSRRI